MYLADNPMAAPDACTLPTAEQPLRRAEFDALFRRSVREVHRVGAQQVRIQLAGGPGLVDEVRDLVARETECCSFFDFAVATGAGGEAVTLDIRVPAGQVGILDALTAAASAWAAR